MRINGKDISYGIVAYIDFLGFSSKVKAAKSLADFKKIIQQVRSFRDEFKEDPESLKPAKKEVIAFSDCMMVFVAEESEISSLQGKYDTWLSDLSLFAFSQFNCTLKTNIFLRGGVSDGQWYHRDNVIVSSALVEAYRLEKEEAKHPIIVLSDRLAEYFTNPDNYKAYSYNPTEGLLSKVKNKGRNAWFIDYLGYGVEELGWRGNKDIEKEHRRCQDDDKRRHLRTAGWKLKAEDAFKRHKKAILNAYSSSRDDIRRDDIRQKYKWLAKYHNDVIERYGNHFEDYRIDKLAGGKSGED